MSIANKFTIKPILLTATMLQPLTAAAIEGEVFKSVYEMPNYIDQQQVGPGTHLNAPGDTYRYTFLIDDKYSQNPDKYQVHNALIGVHILDTDWNAVTGDTKLEWGRILINGKTQNWIVPSFLKGSDYRDAHKPKNSGLYEMVDDYEIGNGKPIPAYIFDVTSLIKQEGNMLTIEVTNLREDGSVDSDAPYGEFSVLRVGFHLNWIEK